ncbi:MAG: HlyC/CorC family transporter [Flavobacteriales bacterium]|nr:HlyC/CorC family transporter [Flavobacteriales bacterium]
MSAFFSGMEIAFVSANKLKLELDKKSEGFTSRIISIFAKRESHFIVTMLIGNNIALVVYGVLMADILENNLNQFISSTFILIIVQTIISTLIILVVAEFIPKVIFRVNSNRTLKFFSLPLLFVYTILYPFILLMIALSRWILKGLFKVEISENQRLFDRVDLDAYLSLLNTNKDENIEVEMLQNALELTSIKARECMVPRTEIVALELETSITQLKEKFIQSKLSKILIYKGDIDNIIGYVHSLDLFKKPKRIKSILMPIPIVTETISASDLLELFITQHRAVAVVVDEYGGTSGMVTVEDVTEEIVGEIEDEHDKDILIDTKIDKKTYLFSARMEVDSINKKYELNLPTSQEYETLAGLLLSFHEDIPEVETEVKIESFMFVVKEVNDRSIKLIQIHLLE